MIRVLLAVFCFTGTTFAQEPLVCRGNVRIPDFDINNVQDIALFLGELKEGRSFSLGSPITEDIEPVVGLKIQKVIPTSKGVLVLATYDLEPHSYMSFEFQKLEAGKAILHNLKGFEGKYSFGPSELTCRPE